MSPGARVAAGTVCHWPSRSAVASGAKLPLSAARALDALRLCQNSNPALNSSRPAMTMKSSQRPRKADTSAATSIM